MWSFRHNFFHMDPHYGDFNVAGVQYQWDDGIFSITLGYPNNGYRTAYFHPMARFEFVHCSPFIVAAQHYNK